MYLTASQLAAVTRADKQTACPHAPGLTSWSGVEVSSAVTDLRMLIRCLCLHHTLQNSLAATGARALQAAARQLGCSCSMDTVPEIVTAEVLCVAVWPAWRILTLTALRHAL